MTHRKCINLSPCAHTSCYSSMKCWSIWVENNAIDIVIIWKWASMSLYDMPQRRCGGISGASTSTIRSVVVRGTSSCSSSDASLITFSGMPIGPAYPVVRNWAEYWHSTNRCDGHWFFDNCRDKFHPKSSAND